MITREMVDDLLNENAQLKDRIADLEYELENRDELSDVCDVSEVRPVSASQEPRTANTSGGQARPGLKTTSDIICGGGPRLQ